MAEEIRQPILGVAGQRDARPVQIEDLQFDLVMHRLAQQGHGQLGIRQPRQHPRPLRRIRVVERDGGKIIQRAHGRAFPNWLAKR
ncbi:hypothetical protein [Paracoccus sp. NBH48]|uniref:hypothetical protein n=1 Tax=Paracoccus sp. NBH48 TaxID=2596918 RepID=UPI00210547E9|nr:hypothetical protein [Paracoccus sp. NBH48]